MPFDCSPDFEPLHVCAVPYGVLWINPESNLFAIVDLIDLPWAQQWLWQGSASKSGVRRVEKWYASRTVSIYQGREEGPDGKRRDARRAMRIWLHKEILLRDKGPPPSKSATIGDHRNGNSLDCRRHNLRWATSSENRRNLFGSASHQLHLGFKRVEPRHLTHPRVPDIVGFYQFEKEAADD
jgi:hypothetical protein